MGVAGVLLLIVPFSPAPGAQEAGEQQAPDLEIVKLEISIKRVPVLEESSEPRGDPATLQQKQNETAAPRDEMRGQNEPFIPRYDRNGQVIRPSNDARSLDPKLESDLRSNRYRFIASLEVHNSGKRVMKSVSWDYILTSTKTKKEIGRFGFRNRGKIGPGETTTFIREVKPSTAGRRAEITRIDYADGSHWRRRASK